jgi:hypothetical protein
MTLDCTCNRLIEAEAKAAKWDAIVRCGECKSAEPRRPGMLRLCSEIEAMVKPDGFCAWGERRES